MDPIHKKINNNRNKFKVQKISRKINNLGLNASGFQRCVSHLSTFTGTSSSGFTYGMASKFNQATLIFSLGIKELNYAQWLSNTKKKKK